MNVQEQETAVQGETNMKIADPREMRPAEPTPGGQSMAARLRDLALRDESGSAVAEMAFVVVPLMVLMITGMAFFGIALNNDLALNNAVQAGAEQLALLRGNVADPCASTVTDVQNAAPGLAASSLRYTVTLCGTSYSSSGTTTPSCAGVTMTTGEVAVLTVTYPVTVNVFAFGSHTYTMSATTTELIQ
jgi:Flp pilus assembly protein TadG